MDPLFHPNNAEKFKGLVHLGVFGLAVACLGYNLMALSERREPRLAFNSILYTALAGWEAVQVLNHHDNR